MSSMLGNMRNKLEKKINENWTFRKVSDKKWLKAQVPRMRSYRFI